MEEVSDLNIFPECFRRRCFERCVGPHLACEPLFA